MESKKTKSIFRFIATSVLVFILIWLGRYLFILEEFEGDYTKALKEQITLRDSLIHAIQIRDSISSEKAEMFSKIDEYVNNCEIIIDGKQIKTSELISKFNALIEENAELKNEVINLNRGLESNSLSNQELSTKHITEQTSLAKLRELLKRDYGIEYEITSNDGSLIFRRNFSRADSALIVFRHFDGRLYKEPQDTTRPDINVWTIEQYQKIVTQDVHDEKKSKPRKSKK